MKKDFGHTYDLLDHAESTIMAITAHRIPIQVATARKNISKFECSNGTCNTLVPYSELTGRSVQDPQSRPH